MATLSPIQRAARNAAALSDFEHRVLRLGEGFMNNQNEHHDEIVWQHGFKFTTGALTTESEEYGSFEYPAPYPGEKWSAWFAHPSPCEPDGCDCGPGRIHVMNKLDARYAPSGWWPWFVRYDKRDVIGRSDEKTGVRAIQMRRIRPKVFHKIARMGYLRGADLRGANLYKADLEGANLYKADLYWADLYGADLYGADLREANLYKANLEGANLYGADLYGADLEGANLRGADLYGANLEGARIGNLLSVCLLKPP